jgi:type II secretory pathway component PulF
MPKYRYEVKAGPDQMDTGVMEAESPRAVIARLREMGFYPLHIEEAREKEEKGPRFRLTLKRIGLKDRNIFLRQLANLLESGMVLTRALGTLAEQTENPRMVEVIQKLRSEIEEGATFAEALERQPKVFPPLVSSLVHAGETGGMLEEVLWRLVDYGEQEEELKGKAVSAAVYPCFLMFMGAAAVFILMSFVFPVFTEIFADLGVELPWPTKVVMAVSGFMGAYWWLVLLGAGGFAAGFVSFARSPAGRRQLDAILLRLPVAGGVALKFEMAKFARTLGTLLDNGVAVIKSIRITAGTMGNRVIGEQVAAIESRVSEGDTISETLAGRQYFPPLVVNTFAVGEESGRIGAVAKRIAEVYNNEVDRAVKAMTALMEPALIVVMGIIIGFLVFAMLLPLLTLGTQFH